MKRIDKAHIDVAKFIFVIVAIFFAAFDLVSWWVVFLFFLYSLEFKFEFERKNDR